MYSKIGVGEWDEKRYNSSFFQLQSLIQKLPDTCLYKAEAQAVLDTVKSVKENIGLTGSILQEHVQSTYEPILETLDLTSELLRKISNQPALSHLLSVEQNKSDTANSEIESVNDLKNDEDQDSGILPPDFTDLLELLRKYDEVGQILNKRGQNQILGAVVCVLATAIFFGIFMVFFFLAPLTLPLMGVTSGLVFLFSVIGGFCGLPLGTMSFLKSFEWFSIGLPALNLGKNMHRLFSKVEEKISPENAFSHGLECLEKNNIKEAINCFARVPVDNPNYENAQGLIKIYKPGQSKGPNKQDILNLDPSYRERKEKRKLEPEPVQETWVQVRDQLGRNSPEYFQYLVDQNIQQQQVELAPTQVLLNI